MAEEKLKLEDLLGKSAVNENGGRIDYVAIIGAGVMGQGIAQTISAAGVDALIVEKNQDTLEAAQSALKESMQREIARWGMTQSEMKAILSRITWTLDMNEINECDLVIEAVEENFELKRMIFKQMDEIAKPDTILISNTSTLSLTKIAEITDRPEKIIGVHFLHPVPKIPLVELIRGLKTADSTVEIVKSFAAKIGKTPVEVYEYPGFVTTRVIVPYLNEAMYVLLEGIASAEDIDVAMKLGYNLQIGPLELADNIGLDELLHWMQELWNAIGEPRYRPCPILRQKVRDKKLGKKSGEGFFKYDKDGNKIAKNGD